MSERQERRIAIVGTAPSWVQCPFDDPGLEIWGLNDAWSMKNWPANRTSRWVESHPLDRLFFRPLNNNVVYAESIPYGFYVRPQGHIEKLIEMSNSIPVFLQSEPVRPPFGPNAQRIPIEQLNQYFGFRVDKKMNARIYEPHEDNKGDRYWASGPAYEIALAILEGVREIQIWGIHLSTEAEYREQRANFEELLGIARGCGIRVIMANDSPVLKHEWQYAYEPKPALHPAKIKLMGIRNAKSGIVNDLTKMLPDHPIGDRMRRLHASEMDCIRAMDYRVFPTLVVAE